MWCWFRYFQWALSLLKVVLVQPVCCFLHLPRSRPGSYLSLLELPFLHGPDEVDQAWLGLERPLVQIFVRAPWPDGVGSSPLRQLCGTPETAAMEGWEKGLGWGKAKGTRPLERAKESGKSSVPLRFSYGKTPKAKELRG